MNERNNNDGLLGTASRFLFGGSQGAEVKQQANEMLEAAEKSLESIDKKSATEFYEKANTFKNEAKKLGADVKDIEERLAKVSIDGGINNLEKESQIAVINQNQNNEHRKDLWKSVGSLFNTVEGMRDVHFSNDGKKIIGIYANHGITEMGFWEIERGNCIGNLFPVSKYVFSRDKKIMAGVLSYKGVNQVKLWKLNNGDSFSSDFQELFTSPDGQSLVSVTKEREFCELENCNCYAEFNDECKDEKDQFDLKFSPHAETLISVSLGKDSGWEGRIITIKLWDVQTGKYIVLVYDGDKFKTDVNEAVAYSPNDKMIIINKVNSKTLLYVINGQKFIPVDYGKNVEFDYAHNAVVIGNELYDMENGNCLMNNSSKDVTYSYSPDKKRAVSKIYGCGDNYDRNNKCFSKAQLIEVKTGQILNKELYSIKGHDVRSSHVFSPDGKRLIVTTFSESIEYYSYSENRSIYFYQASLFDTETGGFISCLSSDKWQDYRFSTDGEIVFNSYATDDKYRTSFSVKIYDAKSGNNIASWQSGDGVWFIGETFIFNDNKVVAIHCRHGDHYNLYELSLRELKNFSEISTLILNDMPNQIFSHNGKLLLTEEKDQAKLWEIKSEQSNEFRGKMGEKNTICLVNSGEFLVRTGILKLWKLESSRCFSNLYVITNLIFSPNKQRFIFLDKTKQWKLAEVKNEEDLKHINGKDNLQKVFFSYEGNLMAGILRKDNIDEIVVIEVGKTISISDELSNPIFSPNGNMIAGVTSKDNMKQIKIFAVENGKCISTIENTENPRLSQNGKYLLSTDKNIVQKLWNVDTGECLNTLYFRNVMFSPHSNTIVAWGNDFSDKVEFWENEDGPITKIKRAEDLFIQGTKFCNEGKYVDAIANYQAAIQLNPNNEEAKFRLSIAKERAVLEFLKQAHANICSKNYAKAVDQYKSALRLDPENETARKNILETEVHAAMQEQKKIFQDLNKELKCKAEELQVLAKKNQEYKIQNVKGFSAINPEIEQELVSAIADIKSSCAEEMEDALDALYKSITESEKPNLDNLKKKIKEITQSTENLIKEIEKIRNQQEQKNEGIDKIKQELEKELTHLAENAAHLKSCYKGFAFSDANGAEQFAKDQLSKLTKSLDSIKSKKLIEKDQDQEKRMVMRKHVEELVLAIKKDLNEKKMTPQFKSWLDQIGKVNENLMTMATKLINSKAIIEKGIKVLKIIPVNTTRLLPKEEMISSQFFDFVLNQKTAFDQEEKEYETLPLGIEQTETEIKKLKESYKTIYSDIEKAALENEQAAKEYEQKTLTEINTKLEEIELEEETKNLKEAMKENEKMKKELLREKMENMNGAQKILGVQEIEEIKRSLRLNNKALQGYIDRNKKIENLLGEEKNFECPITHMMIKDPVQASDGQCYEREAITNWIASKHTSPFTREDMNQNSTELPAMKRQISEYREDKIKTCLQYAKELLDDGEFKNELVNGLLAKVKELDWEKSESIRNQVKELKARNEKNSVLSESDENKDEENFAPSLS